MRFRINNVRVVVSRETIGGERMEFEVDMTLSAIPDGNTGTFEEVVAELEKKLETS